LAYNSNSRTFKKVEGVLMSDWRIKQGNGGNIYDDLIEKRRKDLLSDINEIRRYASGYFSPNDNQARYNLQSIRILCWQILERDEVPGVWKQSFKEVKRLKNAISDIHRLSSSFITEGNEPEYLSKILAICKNILPREEY